MTVRAKMKCISITNTADSATARLEPVVSGSEENKSFYRWTPGGHIELNMIHKDTAKQFEPGKEYYVDFTPAEAK
jgi:hypothetical protein